MKVSLDPSTWGEPRFEALRRSLGWTQAETLGTLALFWHGTREAGLVTAEVQALRSYLTVDHDSAERVLDAMRQTGYLVPCGRGAEVTIAGNEKPVELARKRRKWGFMGGPKERHEKKEPEKKQAVARKPPPEKEEKEAQRLANRACWDAYVASYEARYGVPPLRDAKVNTMVMQFVKRIGQERAPSVIRFFVEHDDRDYMRSKHALNCALRDAEALHTQWMLGQATTSQDLRAQESEAHMRGQLQRIQQGTL